MARQDDITELLDFEEEVEQALEKIDRLLRHVIFRIREHDGRINRSQQRRERPVADPDGAVREQALDSDGNGPLEP